MLRTSWRLLHSGSSATATSASLTRGGCGCRRLVEVGRGGAAAVVGSRRRQSRAFSAAPEEEGAGEQQQLWGKTGGAVWRPSLIRNAAIVAHVDHGKTTLVDKLLTSSEGGGSSVERVMDSMSLEKERGITIMSKCTRLEAMDHVFNIVDTPGHADFGGEVERVVSMIDGVVLVVDATEGPLSQTKFVLSKALAAGKKLVVVINKADRDSARLDGEVENDIFEMFAALGADNEQLDYPTLFASAKMGWATPDLDQAMAWAKTPPAEVQMSSVFETILKHIPPPCEDAAVDATLAMAVNNIGYDNFLGPLATGKIESGQIEIGRAAKVMTRDGETVALSGNSGSSSRGLVSGIFVSKAMERVPFTSIAGAGDIVTLSGVEAGVGDTITCAMNPVAEPLPTHPLAQPTLCMTFGPNSSPLLGKEGTKITSQAIKSRLINETRNNVTLRVETCPTDSERMDVSGRGELQLGVLIEEMRREGFELSVSPPRILMSKDEEGNTTEPVEEVTIDIDSEYCGMVIDKLTSARKGNMLDMKDTGGGKSRLLFSVATRGLLGFGPEIKSETHGSAVINSIYSHHARLTPGLNSLSPGKIVSMEGGRMTAYALNTVQERGKLFVEPGDETYNGHVIGENSKQGDMEVNPCKEKKLTNVRSVLADEAIRVSPPVRMTVEDLISYMGDDEMLEVTPNKVRLRKTALTVKDRQLQARKKQQKR